MKRKKFHNAVPILLTLLFISCNFGDTNINPTLLTDAELKEILPSAIVQTAHNLVSIGGRVTGTVIQHYNGIDAQPSSYSQYLIDERTLDVFWRTGLYGGALKDCHLLIQNAIEADEPHYKGIAKILMAINLGIATTCWGEIPYEEAFRGLENLQPKYDSQEDIYEGIQTLLSQAIKDLQELSFNNLPLEDDLIFGGNSEKWIATAQALQARYFLHLSKRDTEAAQKTLDAIYAGAFQLLEGQPDFPFGENLNEAHPLPLYSFERPDQLVMGEGLLQLLEETNDPRLPHLAIRVDSIPIIYQQENLDLYWGQFNAPQPLISLTELKFIESEALLRLGQLEAAEMAFQKAVIAHMEQMHIPSSAYESFITIHIRFKNQTTFDQQLQWLITQKHLSLFAQNPMEAWVDYRRTGFPNLTPPLGANSSFNPSIVIPRRYLYPISERNSNVSNREDAIQRQGGHLLDVDMWAFE